MHIVKKAAVIGTVLTALALSAPAAAQNRLDGPYRTNGYLGSGDRNDNGRYYDEYSFTMDGGQGAVVSVVSDTLDPVVEVYDAGGSLIGSDDDGGDGLNSLLEFTAPRGGVYWVRVLTYGSGSTGPYDILVEPAGGGGFSGPYMISQWVRNSMDSPACLARARDFARNRGMDHVQVGDSTFLTRSDPRVGVLIRCSVDGVVFVVGTAPNGQGNLVDPDYEAAGDYFR